MANTKSATAAVSGFVDQVVKDPKAPRNVLFLTGFPGRSSEEGHTRLYFDVQLSDYVEIPDKAILHRLDKPADLSPLGGSFLWLERDVELIHGKVDGPRSKASFLQGRLAQAYPNQATVSTQIPPCPQSSEQAGEAKEGTQEMHQNIGPTGWLTHTVPTVPACPTPTAQPTYAGCQPTWNCQPQAGAQTFPACPTPTAQPTYVGCLPTLNCLPPTPAAAARPDLFTFSPQCTPTTSTLGCPLGGVQAAVQRPDIVITFPPYCTPATYSPLGCPGSVQAAAQRPDLQPTNLGCTAFCPPIAQAPAPRADFTPPVNTYFPPTAFCAGAVQAATPQTVPLTFSPPTCPVCPVTIGCPAGA